MEKLLETYHRIFFLDLRPWLTDNEQEAKFKQLLAETPKDYYAYQPNFYISFSKPFSSIRKYYIQLINSEAANFLNTIHAEIASSITDSEKKYIVNHAINHLLKQAFSEINKIIIERGYIPEQFDESIKILPNQSSLSNQSFILHYLKHQLVRLLMEVQETFSFYLKEPALTPSEIYLKYYQEPEPTPPIIVKSERLSQAKPHTAPKGIVQLPAFNAIRGDFRSEKKRIYTYDQLIKNPSRFAQVEEQLFQNGYIDQNYNFTDKHGQKQFLAAFYHQLIHKGYFYQRVFPGKIVVKDLDIRKFLDHRYNADVDKQFRNWTNNKQDLAVFIEKDYWLDHLLSY